MNWTDVVAIVLSAVAAGFSIWSFFLERNRNRQEATIRAFEELEKEVFQSEDYQSTPFEIETGYEGAKDKEVVFEGEKSMKIDSGKTMTLKDTAGDGSLSGVTGTVIAADGSELNQNNDGTYTVRPAEQQPTPPRYYYNSTTTTTKDDTKTSSPQTFDAGVGIYAVTAVLSVTGMAWTAKKRH